MEARITGEITSRFVANGFRRDDAKRAVDSAVAEFEAKNPNELQNYFAECERAEEQIGQSHGVADIAWGRYDAEITDSRAGSRKASAEDRTRRCDTVR